MLNPAFDNISIDIINGFKGLNIDIELKKLDYILNKYNNICHVSIYDLTIEKGSSFFENNYKADENDNIKQNYEIQLKKILKEYGFKQYEISNFSKLNKESLHNLNYWKYNNYIGIGPSAHSTINNRRIENNSDITEYLKNDKYGKVYLLTKKEQIQEFMLMGLRIKDGISVNKFNERFDENFIELFKFWIKKNIKEKMIILRNNNIKMTAKGYKFLNRVLVDFFNYTDKI